MQPRKRRQDVERENPPAATEEPLIDDVVESEGGVRSGRDWDETYARETDEEGAVEQPIERPDPTRDPDLIDETENRE